MLTQFQTLDGALDTHHDELGRAGRGHTELGEMVVFSGKLDKSLIGHFVEAELTSLRGRTFRAKMSGTAVD